MRTVAAVVTARSSYGRCKSLLRAIETHSDLKLELVLGGSAAKQPVLRMIQEDGYRSVHVLEYWNVWNDTPLGAVMDTGRGVGLLGQWMYRWQPDVVVTIADRHETLATAIAASYQNIPLAHLQGGEVSGNIDEKVRHAVTKLADLHFVATEKAGERIIRMGEDLETVFVTGCPSIDLCAVLAARALNGSVLAVLHPETERPLSAKRQAAVVKDALSAWPVIFGKPGFDPGRIEPSDSVQTSAEVFLSLAAGSQCVAGNSSMGIRECSFLGTPAVNIGDRQRGRERAGNVVDVPFEVEAIRKEVQAQIAHGPYPSSQLYGDGHAGERIAELLATVPLKSVKQLAY